MGKVFCKECKHIYYRNWCGHPENLKLKDSPYEMYYERPFIVNGDVNGRNDCKYFEEKKKPFWKFW